MIRSSVDLPQPDGPIREMNSFGRTSRSIPSSAVTPVLNDFERPLIETAGWVALMPRSPVLDAG